jgi:hypothetical protein
VVVNGAPVFKIAYLWWVSQRDFMSAVLLKVRDTTASGSVIDEVTLSMKSSRVTIKDIIETRVLAEVDRYNNALPEYFKGLVQPTHAERTLNGYRMRVRQKVDPEKQVYIALDAFQKNGYFVLVDEFQADGLDQEVMITPETQISFLKLTPLVGG